MMMPAGLMLAVIFSLAGRLSDAMPASFMIIGGLVLFAAGFALMVAADADTTFWTLVGRVMVSRPGPGAQTPIASVPPFAGDWRSLPRGIDPLVWCAQPQEFLE